MGLAVPQRKLGFCSMAGVVWNASGGRLHEPYRMPQTAQATNERKYRLRVRRRREAASAAGASCARTGVHRTTTPSSMQRVAAAARAHRRQRWPSRSTHARESTRAAGDRMCPSDHLGRGPRSSRGHDHESHRHRADAPHDHDGWPSDHHDEHAPSRQQPTERSRR